MDSQKNNNHLFPCCSSKNQKVYGSLIPALILIFLGTIFLLNNFDILPWQILWKFWPLILILIGLSILLSHLEKGLWGFTIICLIVLFLLAVFVFLKIFSKEHSWSNYF